MQPNVYIVILNWNGLKDTTECLESLRKLEYPNYNVIVVDNGSTDNSVEIITKKYPEIKVIANRGNLGFSGGCNVGIDYSLRNGAYAVWLLNNDALVTVHALNELVLEMKEKGSDVVGSDLRSYPDGGWQGGGGNMSFLRGTTFSVTCTRLNVQSISGASLLIKSSVFDRIGMLDDRFFLYWEDVDFSFRARKAGFKLKLACNSIVYHRESASTNKISNLKAYYLTRNCIYFLKKHYSFGWRILMWPFLMRSFLSALKNGIPIIVIWNAICDGLKNRLGKKDD